MAIYKKIRVISNQDKRSNAFLLYAYSPPAISKKLPVENDDFSDANQ